MVLCRGDLSVALSPPPPPTGTPSEGRQNKNCPPLGEVALKRGRENGSFPVEEGNEVKDRVLETVGFQGVNPIYDGGVRTNKIHNS